MSHCDVLFKGYQRGACMYMAVSDGAIFLASLILLFVMYYDTGVIAPYIQLVPSVSGVQMNRTARRGNQDGDNEVSRSIEPIHVCNRYYNNRENNIVFVKYSTCKHYIKTIISL